jgi:hypothetical protein
MQDVLVQLDASFDQRPFYIIVAWLRHRDSQVIIGEPLAIIQDGDTRKVISAPCSGRIVAIYADPGAPLLPRSIIGLIRPGLPLAIPASGINNILIAAALIAVAVVIVPALNGIANQSTNMDTPAPSATTTTNSWWPFDVTPQPTGIATQATDTSITDVTPAAETPLATNDTPIPEITPATDVVPATEATLEPAPLPGTNDSLIKRIGSLINEMITLTIEIRPWIQTMQLINPQINEQMIIPRITRNQKIIEQLYAIANENSTNTALTPMEQQLIAQLDQFIAPCAAIYQEVQTANVSNTILPDLSEQYIQCNNGADNLVQYLGNQ